MRIGDITVKWKVLILLFAVLLIFVNSGFAQPSQEERALKAFKPIVNRFTQFLKTNPELVGKHVEAASPTGVSYAIRQYIMEDNISYNIEKTNSIVSPFIGYIEATVTRMDNDSCGNICTKNGCFGRDNITDAINSAEKKCERWSAVNSLVIKFIFAYQDNGWIFKDVKLESGHSVTILLQALSKPSDNPPITEPEGISYNRKWANLVK